MHFDLFRELAVPDFTRRNEGGVFRDTIEELALAAASQRTRSLRRGHAVALLPYHRPLQVAGRLATLDVLSDGRAEFGFGRGFSPREYATD